MPFVPRGYVDFRTLNCTSGTLSLTKYRRNRSPQSGIATPLIAHWPSGITAQGKIVNKQYFHFMDVMPTLLEVASAEYPSVYKGKVRTPLEGVSMLPYMQDPNKDSQERLLFWQHETHWDKDRAGNQSKLYVWIDSKRVAESDLLNHPLSVRLP